ncbi:universal stress protein [Pararhodobacter marinus]|uniref:Universal stress protein UspA n=1 Tax=Pararhodobacter marinus TaxID=2184063 RepID=A0A2U2C8I4_9RHOB|nr:universal stress protein [Pararhodobacter marinus]PWE28161.1 universal stress protein UspA [Pararhodobacter marinus]
MFSRIMVPVDLTHLEQLDKALTVSEELAQSFGAEIVYVSVTAETPTKIAHNPKEFAQKLEAFAAGRPGKSTTKSYSAHDPAIDIDKTLLKAIDETGADLVVMASHKPGIADFFWGSHGASLAAHTGVSVFVVR